VAPRLPFRDSPPRAPDAETRSLGTFDAQFEARIVRVWALVGEAIAGATHALLGGDRELAKALVRDDEVIDELVNGLVGEVTRTLELGTGSPADRRRLI